MTRRLLTGAWMVLFSIVAVGVLAFGVFPTRTFLSQRADLAAAEARLATLEAENAALTERAEVLRTDDAVERLAREHHLLVYPGEEAYALTVAPRSAPPAWVPARLPLLGSVVAPTPPPDEEPPAHQ